MKIVFSRKGFDSSNGGMASPIFCDGKMFSLPILANNCMTFQQLNFVHSENHISTIVNNLSNSKYNHDTKVHYDPQYHSTNNIMALGQCDAALGHLKKQGVGKDDIFLFYGWFREVTKTNGNGWKYVQDAQDLHVIWSYMKIEQLIVPNCNTSQQYPYLKNHPHLENQYINKKNNGIYISQKSQCKLFDYDKKRILTNTTKKSRADWVLPDCFNVPEAFTYLNNFTNMNNGTVNISYRGYGQEFVLDLDKVRCTSKRNDILKYINHIIT